MTLYDPFAKSLPTEFLDPYGTTVTNLEVSDDPCYVDLYFEPTQDPSELGLLGQMARIPCLIESFRNSVDEASIQSCLLKALMVGTKQQ